MQTHHIVVKAMSATGLHAEAIFKQAYEYSEVRVSKKYLIQRFLDYVHRDVVPQVVEDFCLDILTHRIHETEV